MEWATYAVQDFIPFGSEVYLRLVERVNGAYWPLHLLATALAFVALALALRGLGRFSGPILALLWTWVGYGFLQQYYADLNWAGHWLALAFYAQALLLALLVPFVASKARPPAHRYWPGLLLCIAALVWPLVTLPGRDGLTQLEVLGIHPDPTAVFALGLLLLMVRVWWLLLLLLIPLLWCLIAGLTLGVLALPQGLVMYALAALVLLVLLCSAVTGRRQGPPV